MKAGPLAAFTLLLALACEAGAVPPTGNPARARLNYLHHCVGCHHIDGSGAPERGIPSMRGVMGHFLRVPEGRGYLVQVPGVMNTPLKDADIAELMNWMLGGIAGASRPDGTLPYTAEEVARLRLSRPVDIPGMRHRLVEALRASDIDVDAARPR